MPLPRTAVLAVALALLAAATPARSQSGRPAPDAAGPALEPVAETRLLMDGLAGANFRGLDKLLEKQPASAQDWAFARGQALLIAETANLLMLRPPRTAAARDAWFDRAGKLRSTSTDLARALAGQEYARSRQLFVGVANACNNCHTAFRVPVEVTPFAQK